MGEGQGQAGEKVGTERERTPEDAERERTPEDVRTDIERTRTELGDTVAELAAKTDVKAQAHRAVDNAKATVTSKASEIKESAGAKKDEMTASAQEAMPPSADAARRQVVRQAQDHRLALIALAAFGAGLLIGKRRA
jgi:F0F1-type ATP synthase membrane subunit b/b'